jgi:hypothetical protein
MWLGASPRAAARPRHHQGPAQPGRDRECKQDGGEGHRGRDMELLPQQLREGQRKEPRRDDPLFGQQGGHGEDYEVG